MTGKKSTRAKRISRKKPRQPNFSGQYFLHNKKLIREIVRRRTLRVSSKNP